MKNRAFTLIELLIVVSIISLLSTIVMYSTSEAKLKAEDAHMKVESDQVAKAVQLYKDDNGGFAPVGASYVSSQGEMVKEGTDEYNQSMSMLVPKYLPEIPRSPDGESYSYLVSSDGKSAVFAASLKSENSSSGGSSKSSCDVVDGGGEWGSCSERYEGVEMSYLDYGDTSNVPSCSGDISDYKGFCDTGNSVWVDNRCSEISFNTESERCFDWYSDINLDLVSSCNISSINGTSSYEPGPKSLDQSVPDYFCRVMYMCWYGGNINLWWTCQNEPSLSQIGGSQIICEYTGGDTVCSGSSNSDYCSCI